MQCHAIPCNTMQNHAIPCNTMQYNAIPCNTMQYHAIPCIINNCWRSVPLPCGQYNGHFFEQREFNALEVSLVAFFIHQPRSVNIDSVIKKTKVWFSFPAPKAECMHSGGAQGKMKGIQWIGGFLWRGCLQHIGMKGNEEIQRKTQMEVGNAGLIHKRGCRIKGFP